jgi:hypothetical protein
VTGGGGVADTVSDVCELTPSLAAVMVVVPLARVVARPLPAIVATPVFELVHVNVRPLSALPAASRAVAEYCTCVPGVTVLPNGEMVIEAIGTGDTVAVAEACLPSTVACTTAEPTARAVTIPVEETCATVLSDVFQLTPRSVSTFPAESFAVAVSCTDLPTGAATLGGEIVTSATLGGVVEPPPGVVAAEQATPAVATAAATNR